MMDKPKITITFDNIGCLNSCQWNSLKGAVEKFEAYLRDILPSGSPDIEINNFEIDMDS